jgi:hypothetical protein
LPWKNIGQSIQFGAKVAETVAGGVHAGIGDSRRRPALWHGRRTLRRSAGPASSAALQASSVDRDLVHLDLPRRHWCRPGMVRIRQE